MRKRILILTCLMLLLIATSGWCAPSSMNWGESDLYQQLKRVIPKDMVYAGSAQGGGTSMASTETAVPTSYAYVKKSIHIVSTAQAGTLANGAKGQLLIFEIVNDPNSGGSFVLTPTTATGFTSLTFNAKDDAATLLYVDDTTGWVIVRTNSVTINHTAGGE